MAESTGKVCSSWTLQPHTPCRRENIAKGSMFGTWTWACLKSRTIYTIKAKYDRIFLLLMLTIAHALYVVNKNNDETGTWFFHMLMLAQEAPWSRGCSYNFEIKTIWTGTRWHHHVIDMKVLILTSSASGQEVRKESKIWTTIKDKLLNNGVTGEGRSIGLVSLSSIAVP